MDSSFILARWHQCAHEGTLVQPGKYNWTCASFGLRCSKSIGSAIFAQHTAVSLGMPRHVLSPNNCLFACRISASSNTCFLGPNLVHNPNDLSIGSAVFAQLSQKIPTFYNGHPFSKNFPFRWGIWAHLMGPYKPTTQTALDPFSRFCTDDRGVSLHFTMGRPSPQNCLPTGDVDPI